MPSLPISEDAARELRAALMRLTRPISPSEREVAGEDEVHLTSGELAEMLREAKAQAFDLGFSSCNDEYGKQRRDASYPINRVNPFTKGVS